ncbi:MAG: transcriptional regulator NrdR [Pseudomonadota bacterium]
MRCPFCGSENTHVKDSRPAEDGASIRRRRACDNCGARFTTFERVQLRDLTVLKSDGRKAPFDRDKLHRSIDIAVRKRDVEGDVVDRLVSDIVRALETSGESETPSHEIGALVMKGLAEIDQVAYVRYASVYRNFTEAKDFEQFLGELDNRDTD